MLIAFSLTIEIEDTETFLGDCKAGRYFNMLNEIEQVAKIRGLAVQDKSWEALQQEAP